MSQPNSATFRFHEDAVLFREAVSFTAAETAFAAQLIEKDYFCTVLLQYLEARASSPLVFKGGTCLTKVHVGFYRLSEDLDFTIPTTEGTVRSERRKKAAVVKQSVLTLPEEISCFRVTGPLQGANNCTQYIGTVSYVSLLTGQEETIKIEVSLREALLTPIISGSARTVLLDPVSGAAMLDTVLVRCLSKAEAMAEKFRAALTRREPAIRDFYDIDHAIRKREVQHRDAELIGLVQQKLTVLGNDRVDVSANRLAALRQQLNAHLRPVLRERDLAEFDLDRVFAVLVEIADAVR